MAAGPRVCAHMWGGASEKSTRTKVLEGPCQGPGQRRQHVSRNDFGKVALSEEGELDWEGKEGGEVWLVVTRDHVW